MELSKLRYYAFVDPKKSPGIFKKIKALTNASENIGFDSKYHLYSNTIKGRFAFYKDILNDQSDYIFIRFVDKVAPIQFFILLIARIKGTTIVIDVPTPRIVGLREIALSERGYIYKGLRIILSIISVSWLISPAHKIVQYGEEGWWFKIGIRNKIIKIGNGVFINKQLPIVKREWPTQELRFIAVAELASWHGYDRLIRAIASIKLMCLPYVVSFTIVGDGPERANLESLVKKLHLEDRIIFTGMLSGQELNNAFKNKHIGVSSLALYRKGIDEASDLKTREYMSRGLPVLGVGSDPDFPENLEFRFLVPNDGSIEPIVQFIIDLDPNNIPQPKEIRNYAELNLTYEKKLMKMLNI